MLELYAIEIKKAFGSELSDAASTWRKTTLVENGVIAPQCLEILESARLQKVFHQNGKQKMRSGGKK